VSTAGPALPSNECHVWWIDASAVPVHLGACLDARERQRHRRLRRQADRQSYLAAHVLARLALAHALGHDPAELALGVRCGECESTDHGKPILLHPGADVEFSLSHSRGLVGVAVARGASVGVDVEAAGPDGDVSALVAEVLSPVETTEVLALPDADRPAALIRYWCRKEAVLKATGFGLSLPPSGLTMTGPGEPPRLVDWAGGPHGPASVALHDLEPGPGYVACVALVGWDGDRLVERDGGMLLRIAGTRRSAGRAWPAPR